MPQENTKIQRYFEIAWLPLTLSFLLIVQVLAFNLWLKIDPQYWVYAILTNLSLSTLLFFPAIFFTKKLPRFLYLFFISFIVALIFIAEFIWYKYSGGFLQASALAYAGQTGEVLGTVKTLLSWKLLLFIVPLCVIVGSFFVSKKTAEQKLSIPEKFSVGFLLLIIFCGGYGLVLHWEHDQFGTAGRLYDSTKMYDLSNVVGKLGVVNFYLETAVQYALAPAQASAADKQYLTEWASTRVLPVHGSDFGEFKGKNVIFIQVESLENWVIGYKLNGQLVAPNLTALSETGEYFSNYYSQDGVGNTADAEFSTLNSLYPLPDQVAFISDANHTYDALPALLDENNYTTAVMHGDVLAFWNRANMYPALGYEDQFSQENYTVPRPIGFENLGDNDFFQQSLPKLEALPQPFLATLITLSTHTPFTLPSDLETLTFPKNTTLTPTQQQYLQAVHYSDMALGNFIAGLKKDGLYQNSVIFIWGDHSAFIGTPDSAIQHVPLIILTPNNVLHGVNTEPASHLDIYPTVADLLGIQYPISVLGQDIFSTKTPIVTQRVAGTGAIKFILSNTLKYNGSVDGIFADGTCVTLPSGATTTVATCKTMYDAQVATTKASDLVVRYNLLSLLTPQTKN